MFFADDLLLFAEASIKKISEIMCCLQRFGVYSGQKINVAKSKIFFSHNVYSVVRSTICDLVGMQMMDDLKS